MIIYLPLFFALVGVFVYGLAINPKIAEVGRIMFWTGLLAFLLTGAPALIGVVRR